jgi:hypothetical protein
VRAFDVLLPFDPRFNAAVALWREVAALGQARCSGCGAAASPRQRV